MEPRYTDGAGAAGDAAGADLGGGRRSKRRRASARDAAAATAGGGGAAAAPVEPPRDRDVRRPMLAASHPDLFSSVAAAASSPGTSPTENEDGTGGTSSAREAVGASSGGGEGGEGGGGGRPISMDAASCDIILTSYETFRKARKTPLFAPSIYKNEHFTKTGSGQT